MMPVIQTLKRHKLITWMKGVFNRTLFLYLLAAVIMVRFVDKDAAYVNRLNELKQVEVDLKLLSLGERAIPQDLVKQAILYYKTLLKRIPNSPAVYSNLGFCFYYLDSKEKAIEYLHRARFLAPQSYVYHWDIGLIYFKDKEYAKAIQYFSQALILIPASIEIYKRKLEILQERGKRDLMLFPMRLIHQAEKDEGECYLYLIEGYLHLKDFVKMREVAQAGKDRYPQNFLFSYNLGLANFMLKDYARAYPFFERAMALNPDDIETHYYLGLTYQNMGDSLKSRKEIQAALILRQNRGRERSPWGMNRLPHFDTENIILDYQI